jgi:hypothetical protein
MTSNRGGFGSLAIMQIVVAVYLITLGITGISAYSSQGSEFARSVARMFGGGQGSLGLIVAILELVAGAMVFLSLLAFAGNSVRYAACLISAILWIIWILYSLVFHDAFQPSVVAWLNRLSLDLIVGMALWVIAVQYR